MKGYKYPRAVCCYLVFVVPLIVITLVFLVPKWLTP